MPRHFAAFGKHNSPGQTGWAAVEFSVDEVSDPTATQSDWNPVAKQIGCFPESPSLLFRDVEGCQNYTDQSAVKRHSSLPELEDVERRLQISAQIVEEDVTNSASDHDADDDVEQK